MRQHTAHAGRLVVTAGALCMLTACTVGSAPPRLDGDDLPVATMDAAQVREILNDSWVEDDRIGYFVDGATTPPLPAISLYTTYWNVRLTELDPQRAARLAPDRIYPWLSAALTGTRSTGDLPPLGQIGYAVDLAKALAIKVDPTSIGAALGRLKMGALYTASTDAGTGDWGATAIAVRALTESGSPVGNDTRRLAHDTLLRYGRSFGVEAAVKEVVPLLQIAAAVRDRDLPDPILEALARRAADQIATLPSDPVSVVSMSELAAAAASLGVEPGASVRAVCLAVSNDGGVRLPPEDTPDPQLTYHALRLGCQHARVPPPTPYSRAGWPKTEASDNEALAATVAGLRIANLIGELDLYTAKVTTTVQTVWSPAQTRSDEPVNQARLADVRYQLTGNRTATTGPTEAMGFAKLVQLLYQQPEPESRRAILAELDALRRSTPEPNMALAAQLEASSRTLGDRSLHQEAATIARQLELSPGLYAWTEELRQAGLTSMMGSVLATWITHGDGRPLSAWVSAGLCTPDGRCAENPGELSQVQERTLRVLAILLACEQPACGPDFPVAL